MGLDMYVYRLTKPELDTQRVYERSEVEVYSDGASGMFIPYEEKDNPMYSDIIPYCSRIKVRSEYWDMKRFKTDRNIPQDAYIGSVSGDSISVCYTDAFGNHHTSVRVSLSDMKEKYTNTKVEDGYYCLLSRVGYWRKDYEVQDFFYEAFDYEIENCGYYYLDDEIVDSYNDMYASYSEEYDGCDAYSRCLIPFHSTKEHPLFYHEWY